MGYPADPTVKPASINKPPNEINEDKYLILLTPYEK